VCRRVDGHERSSVTAPTTTLGFACAHTRNRSGLVQQVAHQPDTDDRVVRETGG
jgi:hypothetical protein